MTKMEFVVLILFFTGLQGGATWALQNLVPQKWEYRTTYISPGKEGFFYGSDLKDLGHEKWELVSVVPDDDGRQICYFKRPTPK